MINIKNTIFLYGPFILNPLIIDILIQNNKFGVYILGTDTVYGFIPHRVGLTYTNLANELKKYNGKYNHFCYLPLSNSVVTYDLKCWLYHMLVGLENKIHLASPNYMNLNCPYDSIKAML